MSTPRFIPRHDAAPHPFHSVLKLFLHSLVDKRIARKHGYAFRPIQGLDLLPRNLKLAQPYVLQTRSFSSAPLSLPPRISPVSKCPKLRIDHTGRKRNSAAWTPEADHQLLDFRAQGQTWTQIGQALGKSRQACNRRFDTMLDPKLGRNFWEEDPDRVEVLAALVQQQFTWSEIAEQLGTKASSCEKQWRVLRRQDKASNDQKAREPKAPPKFTRKDLSTLQAAVMQHGKNQWDIIAHDTFNSIFTPTQLRHQYMNQERRRTVWTAAQKSILSLTVAVSFGDIPDITQCDSVISDEQWQSIASQIPGDHSGIECKKKWLKLRVLEQNKKPTKTQYEEEEDDRMMWTQEQSALLRELIEDIKIHGLRRHANEPPKIDWDWVAKEMGGTFTRAQCKSRWTRMSKTTSNTKTGPWKPQELEAMVIGLCQEGASWTAIHREHLSSRSPSFIQGKWKSMVSKIRQDMVIHQRSWPESCKELFHGTLVEKLQELEKRRPELCSH